MIDYNTASYNKNNKINYDSDIINDDDDFLFDNINDSEFSSNNYNSNNNYLNKFNNTLFNNFKLIDYFKNETTSSSSLSSFSSSSLSPSSYNPMSGLFRNKLINGIINSEAIFNNRDITNSDYSEIDITDNDDIISSINTGKKYNLFEIAATAASNSAAAAAVATTTAPYDYTQLDLLNEYSNSNNTILNKINFNFNNNNNLTYLNDMIMLNNTNESYSGCPDFSDQEFARFEFWICGVILNLVGLLGILGNILSMIILSRPQMRSSINYLLIGLARCDTVLIITSILLFGIPSIYPYTGYLFYYYYYIYPNISPCVFPIAMAAQTASVYMTFTVTLERYVAVCHPLKARALCTYGRAKVYFIICILFAFLYNIPRFWEVIVITDTLNYNNNNIPIYNNFHINSNGSSSSNGGGGGIPGSSSSSSSNRNLIRNPTSTGTSMGGGDGSSSTSTSSSSNRNIGSNSFSNSGSSSNSINFDENSIGELFFNNNNYDNLINNNENNDNNVIFCVIASSLRRNEQYINIYIHWCYLIFIYFIPFLSLAILNCLIYWQVQKANRERQRLSRTERREIGLATMLLCVVIVFFLLNFLALYTNILEAFYGIIDDYLIKISNLLVTINSSANFIIYVIFGEKFKRIFLLLFCKGRISRDAPDLIHYESSISNGDGNNRSSGRFSRHGTQRSTTAMSLNRNNNNISSNNNNINNNSNNNGIPTSVRITTTKRIKRNRAPSPGPCVYYPARDVQRTQTVLTPSSSLHFDCYNKNGGGTMTSGF